LKNFFINLKISNDSIDSLFLFSETIEGYTFWDFILNDDYSLFDEKYKNINSFSLFFILFEIEDLLNKLENVKR